VQSKRWRSGGGDVSNARSEIRWEGRDKGCPDVLFEERVIRVIKELLLLGGHDG